MLKIHLHFSQVFHKKSSNKLQIWDRLFVSIETKSVQSISEQKADN